MGELCTLGRQTFKSWKQSSPGCSKKKKTAERHVDCKGLAHEGIKDSFRNWAGELFCDISIKHLFYLLPVT